MYHRIYAAVILFLLLLTIQSCVWSDNCLEGDGPVSTRDYNLTGFDAVNIETTGKVIIKKGDEHSVVIKSYDNILDELEVKVKGGELEINGINCVSNTRIDITLIMPELRGVYISGNAYVLSRHEFESEEIRLRIRGSGEIDMVVKSDHVDASISGSGSIRLKGSTNSQEISITGSGDHIASKLRSARTDILISGSGKAEVHAEDELDVRINGSGDINYSGSPTIKERISGSGTIKQL